MEVAEIRCTNTKKNGVGKVECKLKSSFWCQPSPFFLIRTPLNHLCLGFSLYFSILSAHMIGAP